MIVTSWEHLVDLDHRSQDGSYQASPSFARAQADILDAIEATVWPPGNDIFTIYPESGKKRGEGNGVKPIKLGFVAALLDRGWTLEQRAPAAKSVIDATVKGSRPGAFDCYLETPDDYGTLPFVVEWETGNIASSHRAINRIGLGIFNGYISGGVLILPSAGLARYLTDRIGNEPELRPYRPLWKEWTTVDPAYFGIVAVEHNSTSWDVPRIPKATDGRAEG